MYCKSIAVATAATLFASANAHFFINQPVPIPGSAPKDPLDASGANFPCHGADLSQGQVTQMAAGSSQPLQFELGGGANTAVHGGGSCQIALAYTTDATALKNPANWKVIHSFVGGCPTNAMGNLPTAVACPESSPNCVNQNFTFQIPQEVQNGNAILSWTWFNNIGNREIYQNCAKVSISGGTNSMDSLPGLAVVNLAGINSCTTTENFNTQFADPGKYVTLDPTLNYPLKAMNGAGCSGTGGSTVSSSGSSGSSGSTGGAAGAAGTASPAQSAATGQSTASTGANGATGSGGSNPGGVFAPGAASSPTATSITTTFVTAAATTAPTAAAAGGSSGASSGSGSAYPAGSSSGSGSCTNGQVACTASGFYCIDANTFGMCAWGCATPMQMAAGTQCTNGAVSAIVTPQKKRSIAHLHIARAHKSPLL